MSVANTLSTIIAKLREVEAKATPGPWGQMGGVGQSPWEASPGVCIGSVTHTEPVVRVYGYLLPLNENKTFIVQARNTYPALLDALEIAIGALEEINGQCTVDNPHVNSIFEIQKEALASIQERLEK